MQRTPRSHLSQPRNLATLHTPRRVSQRAAEWIAEHSGTLRRQQQDKSKQYWHCPAAESLPFIHAATHPTTFRASSVKAIKFRVFSSWDRNRRINRKLGDVKPSTSGRELSRSAIHVVRVVVLRPPPNHHIAQNSLTGWQTNWPALCFQISITFEGFQQTRTIWAESAKTETLLSLCLADRSFRLCENPAAVAGTGTA